MHLRLVVTSFCIFGFFFPSPFWKGCSPSLQVVQLLSRYGKYSQKAERIASYYQAAIFGYAKN